MLASVVIELHSVLNHGTIKIHAVDPPFDAVRIGDVDVVLGGSIAVNDGVAGPGIRNARINRQPVALEAKAENRFQADAIEPAGRAGIPGPSSAPGVGWLAVDVRCHDI